ncbi:MAG TPA: tRNA1(Val) (adenine(37)-N6)-methyltransferase [Clostridia bacterium]|nr:tRNA1(Val) (adenine(37)-N6)-methyltransferase [Clostridia bacterium]
MENTRLEYLGTGISALVSSDHGFGTDALLLADFAAPKRREKACDFGSGCGIIPLIWCRDGHEEKITAVEIQAAACRQVQAAIKLNALEDKLEIINADIRNLKDLLPVGGYDLVSMNPPYKAANTGIKSSGQARRIARHELMCSIEDVANAAAGILKFGGRFCLCHRPERLCDVLVALRGAGLEPKRLRSVAQTAEKAPWLILVEAKKGAKAGMIVEPHLFIKKDNGDYSDEMKAIYGDYAL